MGVFDTGTAVFWKTLCDDGLATPILLFRLCLDALVKELMRLNNTNCFALHSIQTRHIERIQADFRDHGIRLVVRSDPCDPKAHSININEVLRMKPDLPISDYKIVAETVGQKHQIHCEVFHNTPF